MKTITVQAPVNIAVIKYWGKKDEELIIPLNDSISGTLSMDQLCATTSVSVSDTFQSDRMWLNGHEVRIEDNKRLLRCLQQVRKLATGVWNSQEHVHICSRNNFPTAAGLASSAAGYACLVYALCNLFDIDDREKISTLARLGSGSACRSIYGGFVHWITGHDNDTSVARQIADENQWPEIRVLVLVVNDHQKDTSSTTGMQLSARTSALMPYRTEKVVPERVQQMILAIKSRDFERFAEITMKDSNQFHAVCQDTYPPIRYMTDVSWSIVNLVHELNRCRGRNVAAYTFDAGPNACIYTRDGDAAELLALVGKMYPPTASGDQPLPVQGINYDGQQAFGDAKLLEYVAGRQMPGTLKYVISTRLGSGAQILTRHIDSKCLLDSNGLPRA